MARRTKKMSTDIQLPVLKIQSMADSSFPAFPNEHPEVDAILASVLRVFAARGRAIREARERQQVDGLKNEDV